MSKKKYLAVLEEIYNNGVPLWSAFLISCNHSKKVSNHRSILFVYGPRRKWCPTCHHCSFLPQNQIGYCFRCDVSFCGKKNLLMSLIPHTLYKMFTIQKITFLYCTVCIPKMRQYPLYSCSLKKLMWKSPELSLLERDYEKTQSWAAKWAALNPLVSSRVIISNILRRCGHPWISWWAGELLSLISRVDVSRGVIIYTVISRKVWDWEQPWIPWWAGELLSLISCVGVGSPESPGE